MGGGAARATEVVTALWRGDRDRGALCRSTLQPTSDGAVVYRLSVNKSASVEARGGVLRLLPPAAVRHLAFYIAYVRPFHEHCIRVGVLKVSDDDVRAMQRPLAETANSSTVSAASESSSTIIIATPAPTNEVGPNHAFGNVVADNESRRGQRRDRIPDGTEGLTSPATRRRRLDIASASVPHDALLAPSAVIVVAAASTTANSTVTGTVTST